jgi:magnesium chelatase family protein
MPVARIASRAQVGLHAPLVNVEVHLGSGLPTFSIVGLPAPAVKESKERVRAALLNSGFEFPAGRITVNLAPADVPKEGGRFDLPIALGVIVASEQLKPAREEALAGAEFYGELALGGELMPVEGLLLASAHAASAGHEIVVPPANVDEAAVASGCAIRAPKNLREACRHIDGSEPLKLLVSRDVALRPRSDSLDLRDIRGQLQAKRALTIAAAGGHSLLMVGPPGSGKSMLAQRLPALLPPLTATEALEVAMIASASGNGFDARAFGRRPFRSPHHTASMVALVGGSGSARPGEVSLAHRGVLFLDELPEFERRALEALREPMETGYICVSRVAMQAEYPAEFQLVAAMNPCPCGYRGDTDRVCSCTPGRIDQYRWRVSGPLLDRIDLRIEVPSLGTQELMSPEPAGESTAEVAALVLAARQRQLARSSRLNSRLTITELNEFCRLDSTGERLFWQTQSRLGISARSYHRILRVARTIADLEARASIEAHHVAEALQLRRAMEPAAA